MLMIGPHLSIAGGYANAAQTAHVIGANIFQFFSRNPRGSSFRCENRQDEAEFFRLRKAFALGPLQAHAPYTLNPASSNDKIYNFARTVLIDDVRRMDKLGIDYLVLHPGSHTGAGTETGIARITQALLPAAAEAGNLIILLETMPGCGTEIGSSFGEIRRILDGVGHKGALGVCLDTCHVFAAGYDIKNNLESVLEEFDRVIGMERLKTIHLNDSMGALGSRKDRHQPLGAGEIGIDAILNILTHPALCHLPFYNETPLDDEGHGKELASIRELLAGREK